MNDQNISLSTAVCIYWEKYQKAVTVYFTSQRFKLLPSG